MLCGDLKANYICHANWCSLPCAFRRVSSRDYVKDFNTLHETANVCDIKILNRIIQNPSKLYVIKLAVYFHSYEKIRLYFQFIMYICQQAMITNPKCHYFPLFQDLWYNLYKMYPRLSNNYQSFISYVCNLL